MASVLDAPTLVLSEEPLGFWANRREDLGLPSSIHFIQRESFAKPRPYEWRSLINFIAKETRERGYGLVVIDSIASLWPVANENDAGEVMDALVPLRNITNAGAGVLLIHHPRKRGGSEFTAARGSGALPGFVDSMVELRRYAPDDNADRRRVLTAQSRFDDPPGEQVIELRAEGYMVIGDRSETAREDFDEMIRGMLPIGGMGITYDAVRTGWPTVKPPGERQLREMLKAGSNRGAWLQRGSGKKGDPYCYLRPEPAGSDSFPVAPPQGGIGGGTNTNGQSTLDDGPHNDAQSGEEPQMDA